MTESEIGTFDYSRVCGSYVEFLMKISTTTNGEKKLKKIKKQLPKKWNAWFIDIQEDSPGAEYNIIKIWLPAIPGGASYQQKKKRKKRLMKLSKL